MRRLSGGILIVAQSLEPIAQLSDTFASLLAFSLLPTLFISLGLGTLIARRSARRVEHIETTLGRIAAGDLSARVATGQGPDDDLSRIGSGIDRMAGKQEAATDALRQVSSDIAHDLRTPLQRISVLLDQLRTELPDTGAAAALADKAADETARAVAVFRSLLQIAQIEGGSPAAHFTRFDLRAPVRQIAELYAPTAEDRGDRFDLTLPDTTVPVHGDAGLVGQALANLLENALCHAPTGGKITVAIDIPPSGPVLTVCDTGPGIPVAERDKVLRRLYRLEQSRTTPGNGLGLALVNAIAALHSARLALDDNGPGLRVTLAFPAVPGQPVA
jgi:signal transduction histidine kinase